MPPGIPTWFIARSHRFSTGTHWRSGVLLRHTDGRHFALLEANRHRNTVELTVRGPSPAAFFSVLDDGLNLTLERFPGLDITRRVPCRCQDDGGEPCPELFDYEDLRSRLARTPPREQIECRKSTELVSVQTLLHGFAPSERGGLRATIDQIRDTVVRVDGKLGEQSEYQQRMFLKLQHLLQLQQEARCPSVFALVQGGRRLTGSAYELRLYCEEPGAWHRLPEPDGVYPITQPANWYRRFGPYLQHLLTILKHVAPLAAPVLGMTVDALDQHVKADCDAMKELMAQAPGQLRYEDELGGLKTVDPTPAAHASTDADFRALEAMLTALDPDRAWGGLSRTTTPEGLTLYLCLDHVKAYRQAV
ncbi:hypothetical protein F0L68_39640 [Solihabitans fulvus]|uniref:C-terminal of Roc COR-B domain-containing protein n=1 Tax=Solihabitans fulvus TaxID=1892852 RepID=A0A5B2W9S3_9PSEU|nr:hypothetical protein [Solihabitans fulvus]KAA2248743.1 hypothetical protein F0L68_39640 [Solihabitans fulvus]